MKRHSRAKLLVSMANKENVPEEETIPSKVFNDTLVTERPTTFVGTTIINENVVVEPLIISPETVFDDTFITKQHTSFPETTTNETFLEESLSILPIMEINDTFVTGQRTPSSETIDKAFAAETLITLHDLNTSDMALTDLDDLQGPKALSVQEVSSIAYLAELQEFNLCQIDDTRIVPMTVDPMLYSDQSLHIGCPHTMTTPPLDDNIETMQIPDTSSRLSLNPETRLSMTVDAVVHSQDQRLHIVFPHTVTTPLLNDDIEAIQLPDTLSLGSLLNPETGLFENELHAQDTNDIQRNDIALIKNKRKYNQDLRVHGKEYDGLVKAGGAMIQAKKPQRQLKPVPCNHGPVGVSDRSFLCGSVNEQGQKDIFYYFWSLSSWEAKKAYVLGSVAVRQIMKRRKTENDTSIRKNAGVDCYLPKEDGIKVRVCRDMFLATLDITKDLFASWTKGKSCNTDDLTQNAPAINPHNSNQVTKPNLKSESVIEWLDQLAKVPSHYCRSSTSRTYVDDAFQSKTKMHKEYVSWCLLKSVGYVQRKRFCEILESKKISIFKPRKDQCDTCLSFKEGNLDEETYQAHVLKKDEARKAKKQTIASLSEEHLVFTMDLQSVQLCPKLLASSQYYKQKLQLHIFTIYVNNTSDVYLYAWHEGDGGVTANEFVTCIIHFIELNATKGFKKMSAISDGCGYQNRNKVLSSALADVSKLQSVEIQQVILEKGHTMMEVDSVHSTLENCFAPPLYSPADYVMNMRKARPSQPYVIRHVDYEFFKNFEAIPSNFASIRPGKKAGDPTVADIRSLLYRKGETFYKLRHDETEWTLLPQRRKADLYEEPQCLYTAPRKIERSKFESLQSLKPFMHRDYHSFYDSLSS